MQCMYVCPCWSSWGLHTRQGKLMTQYPNVWIRAIREEGAVSNSPVLYFKGPTHVAGASVPIEVSLRIYAGSRDFRLPYNDEQTKRSYVADRVMMPTVTRDVAEGSTSALSECFGHHLLFAANALQYRSKPQTTVLHGEDWAVVHRR